MPTDGAPATPPVVTVRRADYRDPTDAEALVELLDLYAREPIGGGMPLDTTVRADLPARLAAFPTASSLLAFADGEPAGLANAVLGFSTFAARPLLNLHDLVVAPAWRGLGIGRRLLIELEGMARDQGCCKLTLEVLGGNVSAQRLYRASGFVPYALDTQNVPAKFWQKPLA
jgi:ribosomal protein S18 acetylase RimI-like enzyme